ncbi:MAG: electron transfer flavoprotein subunit alpha [Chloroflexi bacterium]|nr:MAG: electron transfer flavoprotein subunit alpha [Chloroflexota bacterium]
MSERQGVLVLAEAQEAQVAPVTTELLGLGRRLAHELSSALSALLIGSGVGGISQDVIALGADTVYVADRPELGTFNSDAYTAVATKVCREAAPSVVLMGHTSIGRDIAPRVAARLGASLSTDCVDLRVDQDTGRLLQTRPVHGGNALATIASRVHPQMATMRPRSAAPAEPDPSRNGRIIPVDTSVLDIQARVVETVREEAEGLKLEEARVVVSGGAGIDGAQGFDLIRQLASVLGGAVGATRLPCEQGWVSPSFQIGQTGKIVTPDLYIAVAVSGAPQHMAGCMGSGYIVAINNDPEAHIFKLADFGIVADYREALPALIRKCQELVSS